MLLSASPFHFQPQLLTFVSSVERVMNVDQPYLKALCLWQKYFIFFFTFNAQYEWWEGYNEKSKGGG